MQLEAEIKQLIASNGALTVADYINLALFHKTHGYYNKKDPFGINGDFITAPEISQLFGEMIGVWVASCWAKLGFPENLILAELGPGRGTLMDDLLRATQKLTSPAGVKFHQAIEINMVECSPYLRELQQKKLSKYNIKLTHYTAIEHIPENKIIFIANEFFDALPLHQFIKTLDGWRERLITVKNDKLEFTLHDEISHNDDLVPTQLQDLTAGSVYEISPVSVVIITEIARRIKKSGGAGLVIDYGYINNNFRDSLQAVKKHKFHDILETPGDADITSHVNFLLLKNAVEKILQKPAEITAQGDFLINSGIEIRAQILAKNLQGEAHEKIYSGLERLTSPNQMGSLFKVLSF